MLIPLSSIMFPHMSIMCFTAKKVTAFRKTVVLYPLCIALIWLPCVFLGALGSSQYKVALGMAVGSEQVREWVETGVGVWPNGKPTAPGLTSILSRIRKVRFCLTMCSNIK